MKISKQPADYILVSATCQSEWDNCDFAIIICGELWKEQLKKRMALANQFADDPDFASLKYYDDSAAFYVSDEEEAEDLLSEAGENKSWAYVELEEDEEENFTKPDSRLDCFMQVLYSNGSFRYIAYGKDTGEEFYTETISL